MYVRVIARQSSDIFLGGGHTV